MLWRGGEKQAVNIYSVCYSVSRIFFIVTDNKVTEEGKRKDSKGRRGHLKLIIRDKKEA